MKAIVSRWGFCLLALALCAPVACADTWTVSLTPPGGAISGPPGSTIGWGYTITNLSTTNWLMLTALNQDPFLNATPDASLFAFPILAPLTSLTVLYNATTLEGLFQISWDPNAPVGFTNTGVFVLSAEFWDGDPLTGANFVDFGLDQSAAYSATVAPIPEPATLLLCATGLAGVLLRRRRARVSGYPVRVHHQT